VLRRARTAGLTTALDLVSAASGRFGSSVAPVLPEVDVLFANEYEAGELTGIAMGKSPSPEPAAAEAAARALIAMGVRGWAIVHFPRGACACSGDGAVVWQPSVRVPTEKVSCAVGAGDALAAGVLFGVHEGWAMKESLELGASTAAASLLHPTCSEGVLPFKDCLAFGRAHGFWDLSRG